MSTYPINNTGNILTNITQAAARYLPEPATKGMGLFRDVIGAVGNAFVGGVPTNASGNMADLINLQIQAQEQLQTTTMISNIERSKHESKMSALRNIRVS